MCVCVIRFAHNETHRSRVPGMSSDKRIHLCNSTPIKLQNTVMTSESPLRPVPKKSHPPQKKPLLISFSRRLVWPSCNFIHTNETIQLDFLGGLLSLHRVDPAFFGKEPVLYRVRLFFKPAGNTSPNLIFVTSRDTVFTKA